MKLKKVSLLTAVLAVVAVGVIGAGYLLVQAYSGSAPKYLVEGNLNVTEIAPVEQSLGGSSGWNHYNPELFAAGFQGRTLVTSSIQTGSTLLEGDLDNADIIDFTSLMTAGFTFTLPATSTLNSILQHEGDSRRWIFRNHTTSTSATTLTILKGAGWDLMGIDANVDVLAANSIGIMDCFRESPSSTFAGMTAAGPGEDITCSIQESIAAD